MGNPQPAAAGLQRAGIDARPRGALRSILRARKQFDARTRSLVTRAQPQDGSRTMSSAASPSG
jgi:hypothetical protein